MLTLLTYAIRPLFVQRCIDFAMILTPQFGDAFIEQLRVLLLKAAIDACDSPNMNRDGSFEQFQRFLFPSPRLAAQHEHAIEQLELRCTNADPIFGVSWARCVVHPHASAREVMRYARRSMSEQIARWLYDGVRLLHGNAAASRRTATTCSCCAPQIPLVGIASAGADRVCQLALEQGHPRACTSAQQMHLLLFGQTDIGYC